MPRAFSPEESARIRERLLHACADSFATRGFRGTTVQSLAWAAGISKGAFYSFFDSKESAFVALIEQYEVRTQAVVESAVRQDPAHGIDVLIGATLRAADEHPFLAVAMSDQGLAVLRRMSVEEQEKFMRRDERLVARLIAVLSEAGVRLVVPEAVLLGLLRSLFFVGWHRGEVGAALADEVAGWLIPTLRAALVGPEPAP